MDYNLLLIATFSLLIMLKHGESKPNIVFVMVDDLGWANVGWHNPAPDNAQTPHTMELVKMGIELDHHYAFVYCSPSRSSFMSGRFPYHVQQINYPNYERGQGMPRNMTAIAAKMKLAGYQTAAFGKWHLGCSSWGHIPLGRGFDESFGFFEGAEDHWTQRTCQDSACLKPITANDTKESDLWDTDHPGTGFNNTGEFGDYKYTRRAVDFINKHDPNVGPLFMYFALQVNHSPLEAPEKFLARYPKSQFFERRLYNAMTDFWDEAMKNVTDAIRNKGLWNNTLLVMSSDNGGPVYSTNESGFSGGAGANNYPLKGSKVSMWEGGVRVAAFASGGVIPVGMRGKKLDQLVHITDWYATFCELAGVDPFDSEAARAGLPPVDSISLWPLLSGKNMSSPRLEIPLVVDWTIPQSYGPQLVGYNKSALIIENWKFMQGPTFQTYWQGPDFPNASGYGEWGKTFGLCGKLNATQRTVSGGCLFDLKSDPTEHHDLAEQHPAIVSRMEARLGELRKSHYQSPPLPEKAKALAQLKKNGGFWGPWIP